MKTSTVADLRNDFPRVFSWIEAGEDVAITKRGQVVAHLTPPKAKSRNKVDWKARLVSRPPVGKGISKEATKKLWSNLRD